MERRIWLLDENGQPLSDHIQCAIVSLIPKFQRHFTAFRDDVALIEVLEEAGRKVHRRQMRSNPIERLHAYAWVTLRSVATSRLRRGDGHLAQRTLSAEEGEAALDTTPTKLGSADQVERAILVREVLERLTPTERLVCIWKNAGFSSQEIADRRGGTAMAVDKLLSRVRQKMRRRFGTQLGGVRREEPARAPDEDCADLPPSAEAADEGRDGELRRPFRPHPVCRR